MFNAFLQRAVGAGLIVSLTVLTSCGSNVAPGAAEAATTPATTTTVITPPATTATAGNNTVAVNGLAGEADIADNFDFSTGIQPTDWGPNGNTGGLPPDSADPVGAFRMLCFAGQILRDDPLVMPGQVGASHLHQFWGNTGTNANSTYQSLRTTGQSTCQNAAAGPLNRTAYWMPAMLDGAGHAVKPDEIQTYYKVAPPNSADCTNAATACISLPNGLRYTFGYNMKTGQGGPSVEEGFPTNNEAAFYWMTKFSCWKDDIGTPAIAGSFHSIDAVVAAGCPAGAKLVIEFVAPNCWDGKNVDSADHRSHLAYANRPTSSGYGCPLDHPYLIPNWSGHIHWTTDANFVAGKWRLSSDDMASQMSGQRVPAGSTLHFDYWEAWSPVGKAQWFKGCIEGHKSANRGDLCNGTMLKLWTADPQTHQLVTI